MGHKSSEFGHYCSLGSVVRNLKFFCPTAQLNTQTPSQTVRAKLWQCVSRGVSDRHSPRHTMTQLVLRQAFNWENFSLVKIMCCFSLLRLVEPALALRFPQSCCSSGNLSASAGLPSLSKEKPLFHFQREKVSQLIARLSTSCGIV